MKLPKNPVETQCLIFLYQYDTMKMKPIYNMLDKQSTKKFQHIVIIQTSQSGESNMSIEKTFLFLFLWLIIGLTIIGGLKKFIHWIIDLFR